jgi:hypothetical protein
LSAIEKNEPLENTSHWLSFVLGALGLWAVALAGSFAGIPQIYSPMPLLVVIPEFVLSSALPSPRLLSVVASAVVPLLFCWWCLPLARGEMAVPKRTKVCALILAPLAVVDLIFSWRYGIEYQGLQHTLAMYAINGMALAALFLVFRRNSTGPSFPTNYLFHWLLFAWLGFAAFPYLGELP